MLGMQIVRHKFFLKFVVAGAGPLVCRALADYKSTIAAVMT
jgi:hypothetical protein